MHVYNFVPVPTYVTLTMNAIHIIVFVILIKKVLMTTFPVKMSPIRAKKFHTSFLTLPHLQL